jgi:hypothetical protein
MATEAPITTPTPAPGPATPAGDGAGGSRSETLDGLLGPDIELSPPGSAAEPEQTAPEETPEEFSEEGEIADAAEGDQEQPAEGEQEEEAAKADAEKPPEEPPKTRFRHPKDWDEAFAKHPGLRDAVYKGAEFREAQHGDIELARAAGENFHSVDDLTATLDAAGSYENILKAIDNVSDPASLEALVHAPFEESQEAGEKMAEATWNSLPELAPDLAFRLKSDTVVKALRAAVANFNDSDPDATEAARYLLRKLGVPEEGPRTDPRESELERLREENRRLKGSDESRAKQKFDEFSESVRSDASERIKAIALPEISSRIKGLTPQMQESIANEAVAEIRAEMQKLVAGNSGTANAWRQLERQINRSKDYSSEARATLVSHIERLAKTVSRSAVDRIVAKYQGFLVAKSAARGRQVAKVTGRRDAGGGVRAGGAPGKADAFAPGLTRSQRIGILIGEAAE